MEDFAEKERKQALQKMQGMIPRDEIKGDLFMVAAGFSLLVWMLFLVIALVSA